MKRTWEQERSFCEKRAAEIAGEMTQAINTGDREMFRRAYGLALRYMSKRERAPYYKAFLVAALG